MGFFIFLNYAQIYWSSKKQTLCNTILFGNEFCAMKQATKHARGLRYKQWMIGIPFDEPTFFYGDNQSVLANTIMPESSLNNKTQSVAFHRGR